MSLNLTANRPPWVRIRDNDGNFARGLKVKILNSPGDIQAVHGTEAVIVLGRTNYIGTIIGVAPHLDNGLPYYRIKFITVDSNYDFGFYEGEFKVVT